LSAELTKMHSFRLFLAHWGYKVFKKKRQAKQISPSSSSWYGQLALLSDSINRKLICYEKKIIYNI